MKVSLVLGFIFMISIQPLIMIGMLLGVVIFYSLNIYYESMSFWYGYILMLVLLSGVLVVFTYIISLIPNESFEYFSLLLVSGAILLFFVDKSYMMVENQSIFSLVLWEGIIGGYLMFLGLLLLSIMVMVIFLSSPYEGALRI